MSGGYRRKIVGAGLLCVVLGLTSTVISGWQQGLLTAGFVLIALLVSENL